MTLFTQIMSQLWFLVRLLDLFGRTGQAHGAAGGAPWNPANCDGIVSAACCVKHGWVMDNYMHGYALVMIVMILMVMHGAKHGVMQRVCVQSTEMYRDVQSRLQWPLATRCVKVHRSPTAQVLFLRPSLRHAPDTPPGVLCACLGPGVKYCSHWQSSCASGIM